MLGEEVKAHLDAMTDELSRAAQACASHGTPFGTLLFIMASSEFLALYLVGSRRPAGARGTKALYRFISGYFPRFNKDARDERGRFIRIRVPLLRQGGKAVKRLRVSHALIHLYKRGVLEDLVAPPSADGRCLLMGVGRWGFQIQVDRFHEDFQEALQGFKTGVLSDPLLAQSYVRRFRHLHGWTLPRVK